MLTTLRVYGLLLALAPLPAFAADSKAQPVTPPVAAPAFLDVVSFAVQADGEHHKMIVISAPGALRVGLTVDRLTFLLWHVRNTPPMLGTRIDLDFRCYLCGGKRVA